LIASLQHVQLNKTAYGAGAQGPNYSAGLAALISFAGTSNISHA